ncbi:MAG TPA: glycosyltransferase family 39 protein [Candidatus Binataceae bacterium]|nr:glycosyltransferase family 39 protein [Candidatus Binataceae bacterium]
MSSAPSSANDAASPASDGAAALNWRRWFGAIMALSAILFFVRLGSRAIWASEFRWAEIAREMIATHNYFWPTINGRVYYDKPLGSYWLVVWSTYLTGGMNETAARIPCALAGLLGVALLMMLARRLYESRTAIIAGVVLATSFSFVFFSRHASADVETLTGELAALLLFVKHERRQDGWWVVGLWIIMALTSLTKGLLGFVLPIMVIGLYCTLARGWREFGDALLHGAIGKRIGWVLERNRWLFNWKSIPAIAMGIGIYSFPFWFSKKIEGSDWGLHMVWRENVVRFFHPFDHRGPVYLYVYVIFALMAPWAMLLPAALVEAHHHRREHLEPARSDRFALVYFWATFAFYTISGSRRSYYILPILPAGALLVARLLAADALKSRTARRLLEIGYGLVAMGAVVGVVVMLPPSLILRGSMATLPEAPDRAIFAVGWIVSVAGVVYALRNYRPVRVAVSMGIIAYCVMTYIYLFAMPAADAYRGEKPFGIETLSLLKGDTSHLVFYKTAGPLFYINPPAPLPEFNHLWDLQRAVASGNVQWIIARRRDVPALGVPTTEPLHEASFPWETPAQVRNKVVLLKVGADLSPADAKPGAAGE